MTDKQFMNFFAVILGTLIALAVVIFIIASNLSSAGNGLDVNMLHHVKERVKPVGRINIDGMTPVAEMQMPAASETPNAQTSAAPASTAMDTQTVYQTVCAACHMTGIANSPVLGDKAAWAPRLAAGMDALYTSSLQGKGAMPAKGGRPDISDEVIKQVVDYMAAASR